jgi:hypothetical protein
MGRLSPALIAWSIAVACLAACAACGSRSGPRQGNQINPIRVTGCAQELGDDVPPDQRSMAAMVAALHLAKYPIYQVSPTEFKIYTDFKEHKGITAAWEAQIYSDGSATLELPETMPVQNARSMAYVQKWGHKLASYFNRLKCEPIDQLRSKTEAAGYAF